MRSSAVSWLPSGIVDAVANIPRSALVPRYAPFPVSIMPARHRDWQRDCK
jgi:hypothetical protein